MEREGVLEHGEGSTVLWTSSGPWNPSQQYQLGSLGDFSESTALTELGRSKMHPAENFWSILPLVPKPHHSEIPENEWQCAHGH